MAHRKANRKRTAQDKIPPTGKWVARSPDADSTVSGTLYLELLAIDNREMASVTFYINGQPVNAGTVLAATSRGGIYSTEINTTAFPNGAYNISAYLAAASGPGTTKNLGTITISNAAPVQPSVGISSHEERDSVTLPVTITATVTPAGQTYDTPVLEVPIGAPPTATEVTPNVWEFVVTSDMASTRLFTVRPYITLAGDQRVYGPSVTLENGGYYGTVTVSYAISDTTVTVGDTVTVTPTVTGDATDLSVSYDFDNALQYDLSGDTPASAVTYVYPTPGDFTIRARAQRNEDLLQSDNIGVVTVSPNVVSDTVAPVVSIASPAGGATVSGMLTYSLTATDAVGVTYVRPTLNGVERPFIPVDPPLTSTTVTTTVDTTQYDDGSLTIGGTAYDAAGNVGNAATVVVTVDNIPDAAPDVLVLGNNATVPIADGSTGATAFDHTLFTSTIEAGGGSTRTYTVRNTGNATLTTSGLTVPVGFTITEGLSASITAGNSDTFTVRLDDAVVGVKTGEISFATNVAAKNPYNYVVEGEVTASQPPDPPSETWYDWATARPFSSMTETRRNMSGVTQAYAPVTFLAQFHPGEIPTTHKLQLRDNGGSVVPETDWQWGERSTFPDGSLRSCVVRCYGPASWTANTDQTFTLEKVSGAWPAETDSRPSSLVASASNFRILLEDITLLGSPWGSATQPAYGGGTTLDFDLNRALAAPFIPRKRTAGSILTQWYVWEKLKAPGSAPSTGGDAELWCKCWVNVWFVPGTNTVRHISVHPLLINGWDTILGYIKGFKTKVLNGVTVLRDFNPSFTRTAANFTNNASGQLTQFLGSDGDTTFDWAANEMSAGVCIKVTGDVSSGLTAGKIYRTTYTNEWSYTGAYGAASTGLIESGFKCKMELMRIDVANNQRLALGTGGGTMTFQIYQGLQDKGVHAIRDGDGQEFWPVGGTPFIWPNWTRAEKIRRFQTAMVPSPPIDPVPNKTGANTGRPYNGTKNTSEIPVANHLQVYQPGASLHHCTPLEASGYWGANKQDQGRHKGEVSFFLRNLLNDMCSSTAPWHRIQRQAAAESISFLQELGIFESALDSNGVPLATHLVLNNGPNKNGTRYSGLGPCFPTGGGWTRKAEAANFHWSVYRMSGSHCSKEMAWSYALYCDPSDLEMTIQMWIRISDQLVNAPSLWGPNRTYNGTNYYRTSIIDTAMDETRRNAIGRSMWLAYSLWVPDSEAISQCLKDIVADNVNLAEAMIQDPTYIGGTAKVIGMPTGAFPGVQQSWHLQRGAYAALLLLKFSGRTAPNTLKYLSAFSRWYWGDPVDNAPSPGYAKTGWLGQVGKFLYFDKVKPFSWSVPDHTTNPQYTTWRFRNEASSSTDGSSVMARLNWSPYMQLANDGQHLVVLIVYTDRSGEIGYPQDGERIAFSDDIAYTLPAGISKTPTGYWVYDRTELYRNARPITVSGAYPSAGMTMTSGAKVATIISQWAGNPSFVHTHPAAGAFAPGDAITCSNGSTFTYPSYYDPVYRYKISSTDPAITTTQVTWAAGTTYQLIVGSPGEPAIHCAMTQPRTGPRLGGIIDYDAMAPNAIQHITQPGLFALTAFGPASGCEQTFTNYKQFLANVLAGQGKQFDAMNWSFNYWVGFHSYPPGST